jgi:hypothetical protein
MELHAVASDYRRALTAVRDLGTTTPALWSLWLKLIQGQYRMPNHAITAAQMAEVGGVSSASLAQTRYTTLGQRIAEQVGYVPNNRPTGDRKPMYWMSLSRGTHDDDRSAGFQFIMHPELVIAIELMGWVKPQPAAAVEAQET